MSGYTVAQTIYGSGRDATIGSINNQVFIFNPNTGATTRICTTTTFNFISAAIAQSNSNNGVLYYFENSLSTTVFPRLNSFDPITCTNGTPINVLLDPATRNTINKAAFCPDGRLYLMSARSNNNLYEVNPTTGAIRNINLSPAAVSPTGGGDIVCDNNGNLWMVLLAASNAEYALFRVDASTGFATLPNNSIIPLNLIGGLGLPVTTPSPIPTGLVVGSTGAPGCAPSPAVCLLMSTNPVLNAYAINTTNGLPTLIGTTSGNSMTDLARNFPIDVSVVKTATPTSVKPGETVTYFINVSNTGAGTASPVSVVDTFPGGVYSALNWVCGVTNAGSANLVTTGCSTASGSGNISQTVSLSINGAIRYTVTAVLNSSTTGTLTNVASAQTSSNYTDSVPSNGTSTITVPISRPRAALSVTKSNGTTTLVAGSTTNYTVTFANGGPDAANGAIVQDSPSNGLSNCTVVNCTSTGAASCPAVLNNIFAPSSTTLPSFPAMTSVTMIIRCGVGAAGL
ncbi:DUF11 domain-containing protein [Variovorax sp. PCZ-1]|uniref:DUF6923 family protein n=1 Tax=Variovorax sp. PCZ-1 TaxID=2835533 RepID=UPI001BD021B6|nr:DUF11 domain-containing protein [Variovorax sp. PCZ-1]MBS7806771.1 DUF11 domain-containing protein [Variovorax sp. PCZ-1]